MVIPQIFNSQELPLKLSLGFVTRVFVLTADIAQPDLVCHGNRLPLTENVGERASCIGAAERVIVEIFCELHFKPIGPRDEGMRTIPFEVLRLCTLEREIVVYWYLFSNPRTMCIHYGFSLVGNKERHFALHTS